MHCGPKCTDEGLVWAMVSLKDYGNVRHYRILKTITCKQALCQELMSVLPEYFMGKDITFGQEHFSYSLCKNKTCWWSFNYILRVRMEELMELSTKFIVWTNNHILWQDIKNFNLKKVFSALLSPHYCIIHRPNLPVYSLLSQEVQCSPSTNQTTP